MIELKNGSKKSGRTEKFCEIILEQNHSVRNSLLLRVHVNCPSRVLSSVTVFDY